MENEKTFRFLESTNQAKVRDHFWAFAGFFRWKDLSGRIFQISFLLVHNKRPKVFHSPRKQFLGLVRNSCRHFSAFESIETCQTSFFIAVILATSVLILALCASWTHPGRRFNTQSFSLSHKNNSKSKYFYLLERTLEYSNCAFCS